MQPSESAARPRSLQGIRWGLAPAFRGKSRKARVRLKASVMTRSARLSGAAGVSRAWTW